MANRVQASMEERDQYWQQILQEKENRHTELIQTKARELYYSILNMEWLRQRYDMQEIETSFMIFMSFGWYISEFKEFCTEMQQNPLYSKQISKT